MPITGALKLITAPAVEPITTTEAKLHCRVEVSDEDTLIGALITAAREWTENMTRRALITQTWELVLDEFPGTDEIEIPLPPLQPIISIKYKVAGGSESTFAAANYVVNTDRVPGLVVLEDGVSWPSDTLYETAAVRVRFVAGYGAAGSAVPQAIRQALLLLTGHWYENREQMQATGNVNEIPYGVEALLATYRVWTF